MAAIIFDLDETLLDTSALRADRESGRWRQLAMRLDEAEPYAHRQASVQAAELPARARKLGLPVGVLTDSPRWYAESLLEAFGICCDALITGSDGYAPKPDPSSLHALAVTLGVPIEECIVVGDAAADIAAARGSGAVCIGVAWSGRPPRSWRRSWPDIAIAHPDRLIDALGGPSGRFPCAEAILAGERPRWHWGSLLRLGEGVFGAGRYYTRFDGRHPADNLSRLIISAKHNPRAAAQAGELLAAAAARCQGTAFDVVTSVPPKPGQAYDRFATARAAVADATSAVDSGEILRQRFADPDYKRRRASVRAARVAGHFTATALSGERVLLLDDVITSGAQVKECRRQLHERGARSVTILALGVTQSLLPRSCPACRGVLRLVTSGPYGHFIGCSNYSRGCRYTEPAPRP
jgi:HAD superfamily hydrolase (TIGR01509 family)